MQRKRQKRLSFYVDLSHKPSLFSSEGDINPCLCASLPATPSGSQRHHYQRLIHSLFTAGLVKPSQPIWHDWSTGWVSERKSPFKLFKYCSDVPPPNPINRQGGGWETPMDHCQAGIFSSCLIRALRGFPKPAQNPSIVLDSRCDGGKKTICC